MKRSAFFTTIASLFTGLFAKAQTTITPCQPRLQWGNVLPNCNGQCPNPTCAYIAPPWKLGGGHPEGQPLDVFYTSNPSDPWASTTTRIVRCPKCNTAFWQDPS